MCWWWGAVNPAAWIMDVAWTMVSAKVARSGPMAEPDRGRGAIWADGPTGGALFVPLCIIFDWGNGYLEGGFGGPKSPVPENKLRNIYIPVDINS